MTTRLAALGAARLARPGSSGTPVELVRPLLQHLADVAARAEGRVPAAVPALAPHALGHQLAVLASDVLDLTGPDGPLEADAADDVADRLEALRRSLP